MGGFRIYWFTNQTNTAGTKNMTLTLPTNSLSTITKAIAGTKISVAKFITPAMSNRTVFAGGTRNIFINARNGDAVRTVALQVEVYRCINYVPATDTCGSLSTFMTSTSTDVTSNTFSEKQMSYYVNSTYILNTTDRFLLNVTALKTAGGNTDIIFQVDDNSFSRIEVPSPVGVTDITALQLNDIAQNLSIEQRTSYNDSTVMNTLQDSVREATTNLTYKANKTAISGTSEYLGIFNGTRNLNNSANLKYIFSDKALITKKLNSSEFNATNISTRNIVDKTEFGNVTTTPTHTITIPSIGNGIALYNTVAQTDAGNREYTQMGWSSNSFEIGNYEKENGSLRNLRLASYTTNTTANPVLFELSRGATAGSLNSAALLNFPSSGTLLSGNTGFKVNVVSASASSGMSTIMGITSLIQETSTAGYNLLNISSTEVTTGTGKKLLLTAFTNNTERLSLTNNGQLKVSASVGNALTIRGSCITSSCDILRLNNLAGTIAFSVSGAKTASFNGLISLATSNNFFNETSPAIYQNNTNIILKNAFGKDTILTWGENNSNKAVRVTGTTGLVTANNFASSSAALSGGTINGMTIGATTPSSAVVTTLSSTGFSKIANGKFNVSASSGNVNISGALQVGNMTIQRTTEGQPITFKDASTYWLDAPISGLILAAGSFAPILTNWNNTLAQLYCYAGTVRNEYASGTVELPHSWKIGSTLHPHLHSAKSSATAGNYVFNLNWILMSVNGTKSKAGRSNITINSGAGIWVDQYKDFAEITTNSSFDVGTTFTFRLTRLQDDTADTYTDCVGVKQVSLHFESDSLGSASETSKWS